MRTPTPEGQIFSSSTIDWSVDAIETLKANDFDPSYVVRHSNAFNTKNWQMYSFTCDDHFGI